MENQFQITDFNNKSFLRQLLTHTIISHLEVLIRNRKHTFQTKGWNLGTAYYVVLEQLTPKKLQTLLP